MIVINDINHRIQQAAKMAGRRSSDIHLLAVSKGQSLVSIEVAYALGLRDFGESYWQEARQKIEALSEFAITWHYLGALQRNKLKAIATHFDWVHTVSSLRELALLASYRTGKPLQICIQVDVPDALGQRGVALNQLSELVLAAPAYPQIALRGLMVMLKPRLTVEAQLAAFSSVSRAAETLHLDTLSMGMSDDFEAAIRAGSHWVRIGRGLFGERG